MKLQNKISVRFLLITIIAFTATGILFYVILNMIVHQNMDERIRSRKEAIIKYLQSQSLPDSIYQSPDREFFIQKYHGIKYEQLKDIRVYDADDKEIIPFRKLSFIEDVHGTTYKITIIQSLLESEDLKGAIFGFMLGLFGFLAVILLVLNRRFLFSVWKPFFVTVDKLRTFKIGVTQDIQFPANGIYEFDLLNQTLTELTRKLQADFVNLKEFTENASHEIQTPLAIVKSKLEVILHDSLLAENHRKLVYSAYESVIRLSKLNEALLLLSKIENRQFIDNKKIDLNEVIKGKLDQTIELFELKNIKLTIITKEPFWVNMNPYLADILINNILNNAIKHNIADGEIKIMADQRVLSFSNTGERLNVAPEKLFKRFVKQ
ncbi:MAG: HAMP domain-containing sensor histidine kinase, partial [Bacteroidota bacterium]|nr:HAMP domain-containing sensor histidine kinase [Bacteroidota bacterium]